jgi:HEPN domain-containing protein
LSEPEHVAEARRWLEYAQEDLASAAAMVEGVIGVPRQACWLAQQAAEKALKSVLVFLRAEFPRTHDLDVLRAILPNDWRTSMEHPDLAELSEWSVEARYPGDWPEATASDAGRAVALARKVVQSVMQSLGTHGRMAGGG